jgi:hypothetical protein
MQCPDDETLEMYALGRMPDADPELVAHVESCERCMQQAEADRQWSDNFTRVFKRGLRN